MTLHCIAREVVHTFVLLLPNLPIFPCSFKDNILANIKLNAITGSNMTYMISTNNLKVTAIYCMDLKIWDLTKVVPD